MELHYLKASEGIRRQRIEKRNSEKDPVVYSFELTDMMFDFMEQHFGMPDAAELKYGCVTDT